MYDTEIHKQIDRVARKCTTAPQSRSWASPLHQIAADVEGFNPEPTLDDVLAAAPAWLDGRTDLKPKVRDEYARRIATFKRKMKRG